MITVRLLAFRHILAEGRLASEACQKSLDASPWGLGHFTEFHAMDEGALVLDSQSLYRCQKIHFSHGGDITAKVTHYVCPQILVTAVEQGCAQHIVGDSHSDFIHVPLSSEC
jgi:hypothetical protein